MTLRAGAAAALIGLVGACLAAQSPTATIDYAMRVRPDGLASGAYEVTITAGELGAGDVAFLLPAWKPGAYRIESWHRRVRDVTAAGEHGPLRVEASERRFVVRGDHGGRIVFRYRSLTERHGAEWMSFEGPSTWMYLEGGLRRPVRVAFTVPTGWQVVSGMTPVGSDVFEAPDYDTMADCPVEAGKLTIDRWTIDGVAFATVCNQEPAFELARMREMCTKIVRFQRAIFGELPLDRYYFMWHLQRQQDFYGGLEHLNSTTLQFPQFILRRGMVEAASLIAHEFFHLWNVKRIRPRELGPFDYQNPVRVRSLWFSEGVTDYYADATCVRTGLWSASRYLRALESEIRTLAENDAYGEESVEDASHAAFDRRFMAGGLDYYNAGKLLGLLLDIEIRHATANERSLDDVMRLLLERHGLPRPGHTDEELRAAVNEVAGRDLSEWFARYVAGTAPYPFEEALTKAGIAVRKTVTQHLDRVALRSMMPALEAEEVDGAWTVTRVPDDDAACPFRVGDVVRRFGSFPARGATSRRSFVGRNMVRASRSLRRPTDTVDVAVTRDGAQITVTLAAPARERVRLRLAEVEDLGAGLARSIRDDLLGVARAPSEGR